MDKKMKREAMLAVVTLLRRLGLKEPEAIEVLIATLDGAYMSMLISYEVKEKSNHDAIASLLEYLCGTDGGSEEEGDDGE